jgi:hypothetical protein
VVPPLEVLPLEVLPLEVLPVLPVPVLDVPVPVLVCDPGTVEAGSLTCTGLPPQPAVKDAAPIIANNQNRIPSSPANCRHFYVIGEPSAKCLGTATKEYRRSRPLFQTRERRRDIQQCFATWTLVRIGK